MKSKKADTQKGGVLISVSYKLGCVICHVFSTGYRTKVKAKEVFNEGIRPYLDADKVMTAFIKSDDIESDMDKAVGIFSPKMPTYKMGKITVNNGEVKDATKFFELRQKYGKPVFFGDEFIAHGFKLKAEEPLPF